MQYITQPGDTLTSIAARYTLDAGYGDAIARTNGLTTDMIQTPVDVALEPGISLTIPDQWLKNQLAARAESAINSFFPATMTPTQKYAAVAGAVALLLMLLTAGRR